MCDEGGGGGGVVVFFFQAEDGIRDRFTWLEFRRVLFRSGSFSRWQNEVSLSMIPDSLIPASLLNFDFPSLCQIGNEIHNYIADFLDNLHSSTYTT